MMEQSTAEKLLFHLAGQSTQDLQEEYRQDVAEMVSSLTRGDWNYLIRSSLVHGITPLIYHQIRHAKWHVPSFAQHRLESYYAHTERRNEALYHELKGILDCFNERKIEVLLLKGIRLGLDVYKPPALRPNGDIDLLIHKSDFESANHILQKLGFHTIGSFFYKQKYGSAFHFVHQGKNIWVDLQWKIVQKEWDDSSSGHFNFPLDQMWKRKVPVGGERLSGYGLSVEDMLFHLCLHLEGHRYNQLILLCDISEVVKTYDTVIDWAYITRLAKTYRMLGSLYYPLFLAKHLLGAPVKDSVLKTCHPDLFRGSLYRCLFGDLTKTHYLLDELNTNLTLPGDEMDRFENLVRRHVSDRVALYGAMEKMIDTIQDRRSGTLTFAGLTSDPSTSEIETYQFLISSSPEDIREKIQSKQQPDFQYLKPRISEKNSLHTITYDRRFLSYGHMLKRFRKRDKDPSKALASIDFVCQSPEWICAAILKNLSHQGLRFFALCQLIELFRTSSGVLNGQKLMTICKRYSLDLELDRFLSIAGQLQIELPQDLDRPSPSLSPDTRLLIDDPGPIGKKIKKIPPAIKQAEYAWILSGERRNGVSRLFQFIHLFFIHKSKRIGSVVIRCLRLLFSLVQLLMIWFTRGRKYTVVYWLSNVKSEGFHSK
jgi:hypothetical protein